MFKNNIIEKFNSLYTFNVIIIGKKNETEEGMDRFCINYRLLNKIMILDKYSLLNINEIYSKF